MADPKDKKFLDAEGFEFPKKEVDEDQPGLDPTLIPGGTLLVGPQQGFDTSVSPPVPIPENFDKHPFANQDLIDVATFDFVHCDPIDVGLLPLDECVICIEDPHAFVPDWKKMFDGAVFFDGQKCLYSAVIFADEVAPGFNQKNVSKYISEGIKNILEFNQKKEEIELEIVLPYTGNRFDTAARVASYVLFGPAGLMATDAIINIVESETSYTTTESVSFTEEGGQTVTASTNMVEAIESAGLAQTDYFVSIRGSIPMKVLVSVPVKYIQQIPNRVVTVPDFAVPPNELLHVQIMAEDLPVYIQTLVNSFTGAMIVYDKQKGHWSRLGGGHFKKLRYDSEQNMFVPAGRWDLDLREYAKKIRTFFEDLDNMLRKASLGIPLPGKVVLSKENFVEKITINFENIDEVHGGRIRIKNIKVNKAGCPIVWFGPKSNTSYFDAFEREHRDSTTLGYIGQITEMYNMAAARKPSDWIDFVTKFTYPGIEAVLGVNAFDPAANVSALSCAIGEGILDPIEDTLRKAGDVLSTVIQTKFDDALCRTDEENAEFELEKLNNYTARLAQGSLAEITRYFGTDPLLRDLPEIIKIYAKKGSKSKAELWNDVISRLGKCGWIALLTKAMDCMMKGMGEEDAKSALVKAAFKAMDNANLEKVFIGLPPDKQEEILNSIEQRVGSAAQPWESGYTNSSYNAKEWTDIQESYNDSSQQLKEWEKTEKQFKKQQQIALGRGSIEYSNEPAAAWYKEEKAELRDQMKKDLFERSSASNAFEGSYGKAFGETQKQIFNAYRDAILEVADVDYLLEALNQLPGAQIIATLLKRSPCKKRPPWATEPPLDDMFHLFGDPKFCDAANSDGIKFVYIPPKLVFNPNNFYPLRAVRRLLTEIAAEFAFQMTILILRTILKSLVNLTCMAIANLGASLADLAAGNNNFRDLLRQDLCGSDATDEQIDNAITDLLTVFGSAEASCLESLTQEDIGGFIDQISMTLMQQEMMTLLLGNPSDDTLEMVTTIASLSDSECISELFSNPNTVEDLFSSLGGLTDLGGLSDTLAVLEGDVYINPNVCASQEDLDNLNDIRCFLLTQKGMSEEECSEELKKLEEQAIKDLEELADILQGNGPAGPLIESSAPGCPEDGIFPYTDPNVEECFNILTDVVFETIGAAHVRDLLGARGILNMILSDTNGKGLKAHNFFVRLFGASHSYNLGPISFGYTDNAINVYDQVAPINKDGIPLDGRNRNGKSIINLIGSAMGEITSALSLVAWPAIVMLTGAILVVKGIMKLLRPKKAKDINLKDFGKNPFRVLDFNISNGGFPPGVATWLKDRLSGVRTSVDITEGIIDTQAYPVFETKKGEPDLIFKYEDYKGEYSFEIEYDYNLVVSEPPTINEQGVPSPGEVTDVLQNNYRYKTTITEHFKEFEENADEGIGKSILKGAVAAGSVYTVGGAQGALQAYAALTQTEDQPPEPVVLEASSIEEPDLLEYVKALEVSAINKKSYQVATFNKIIENVLREAGSEDTANIQKHGAIVQDTVFDKLNQKYFCLLSKKVSENTRAFDFGYDETDLPTVDLLDPDKYGGTLNNPPFYINEPERGGWISLVNALVPEQDACEPKNIALGDFKGLTQFVNERYQQIKEDERLQSDIFCVTEAPYDKILSRSTAASMEGITAAIIRIYAIEIFLQALPVFSLFEINIPENFDSILLAYISNEIEAGLKEDGRFPHQDHLEDVYDMDIDNPYFYQFMEQVVQSFVRKLPTELNPAGEGTIAEEDLLVSEIEAYQNLQTEIQLFYKYGKYLYDPKDKDGNIKSYKGLAALNPASIEAQSIMKRIINTRDAKVGMGYSDFSKKKAKVAKQAALVDIVQETIGDAKTILGRAIKEEFDRLSVEINEKVKPQVQTIDSLMLGSPQFVDGSITDGAGNLRDPLPVDSDLDSVISNEYSGLNGSFVLQKYIRIKDKEEPIDVVNDALRTPNLRGVINIEDWEEYVQTLKENGVRGKVSDYWGDITAYTDVNTRSETYGEEVIAGASGWSFGMRLCYVPTTETEISTMKDIVSEISDQYALESKAFKLSGERYYIPLAAGEIEIPDQEFINFDPNTYDIACLYKELISTMEYKALFKYCIPLRTYLSLITIYCIKGFLPSIGSDDDLWTVSGGRLVSGFRRWDQGKLFKKSKKAAKKMFEAAYDAIDQDPDNGKGRNSKPRDEELRDILRPKWNYDLGLRWWHKKRRRPRPYDKYGNEC